MKYLLRKRDSEVVHNAVREGGGTMEIMMTSCGLNIRWDQPHKGWERALATGPGQVTCRRCLS